MSPANGALPGFPASQTTVPIAVLLGPDPLIPGEDESAYRTLVERINLAVAPGDVFEEIWARDLADLVWDAFRLRRLKARLIGAGTPPLGHDDRRWPEELDKDDALASRLENVDHLDRMAMAAEARRTAVLQEIERHRTKRADENARVRAPSMANPAAFAHSRPQVNGQ